jgi:hypothetical protein
VENSVENRVNEVKIELWNFIWLTKKPFKEYKGDALDPLTSGVS